VTATHPAGPAVTPDMDTLTAALAYADTSWSTFPLRGKLPAIGRDDGGHGFHDATTDPERLLEWFGPTGKYHGLNIGLRPPPGVVFLDVDPRDHGPTELVKLLDGRALPPTLTATTGRGDGGFHAAYRMGLDRPKRDLVPGVQLKAHGNGFIVAPPSRHPKTGRPYTWDNSLPIADAPDWLIDACCKPEPVHPAARRHPVRGGGQRDALAGLARIVLEAQPGAPGVSGRNDALN
jgi:Bifunctional DNA primase/polymerase, N-terminal